MGTTKWDAVPNIDFSKRMPSEWALIYHINLREELPNVPMSEYEWAYRLEGVKYFPADMPDSDGYDIFEEMEHKVEELRRDLHLGADDVERDMLRDNYVETKWVRNRYRAMR